MRLRTVPVLLMLAAAAIPAPSRAQAPPKLFSDIGFLIGSWTGTSDWGGRKGGATVRWSLDMNGAYLVQKGTTFFLAQGDQPEQSLQEDGYFTLDGEKGKYIAYLFFSTNAVGVYDVELPAPGTIRLVSTKLQNLEGTRSRITITRKSDTELTVVSELAPAGKDFQTYMSTSITKK